MGGGKMKGRRGRPKSDNPLIFKSVGLTAEQWEWLDLWFLGGSPTDKLRSLLKRAVRFWPLGPSAFGHKKKDRPSNTVL